MRKDNPAVYPIHELQTKRWSPRAFDPTRSITPADLCSLLEAARWSPSSYNGQPWRFVLATKEDAAGFTKLLGCLAEKNQSWAKHASALLLAVAANTFDDGRPNVCGKYDTGGAVANLTFEATSKNIYVHQMVGFDMNKARAEYSIPPTFDPAAVVALGYLGNPATLADDLRAMEEKPKPRRPIQEFTFGGTWGAKSSIVDD